jgi:hypothetical protein
LLVCFKYWTVTNAVVGMEFHRQRAWFRVTPEVRVTPVFEGLNNLAVSRECHQQRARRVWHGSPWLSPPTSFLRFPLSIKFSAFQLENGREIRVMQRYTSTSLIRNNPPAWDHDRALDIVL